MEEKRDKKTNKHTECREEIGNPFSPPVSRNAQGPEENAKSQTVGECSLWTAHMFF